MCYVLVTSATCIWFCMKVGCEADVEEDKNLSNSFHFGPRIRFMEYKNSCKVRQSYIECLALWVGEGILQNCGCHEIVNPNAVII